MERSTTLFAAILSPAFLNDSITFFGTIGKGIVSLLQEFVTGADSFGQLSNRISNSIISEIVYWLIAAIVMGILFIMTGLPIVWIGYQVGKSTGNIAGISSVLWKLLQAQPLQFILENGLKMLFR